MFSAYQKLLHKHPIITKSITCGILFSLGDCVTQHFVHKNDSFDFKRNISFGTVGLLYTAPMLHVWHSKLVPIISSKLFSNHTSKIIKVGTLVAIDQLLFIPILLSGFFVAKSLTESFSVQGLKNGLNVRKVKLWETLQCNWMIWPIATTISFWYIPIHLRVLFSNFIGFFWNIILSYIAYD